MSPTNVLPLLRPVNSESECPSWCAREAHIEATGSHAGAPVELALPQGKLPATETPLLSVRIVLGHDEELRGDPPRLWLSDSVGSAEWDSPALGALILGLEDFALRLRGLQHRYDTVVVGGAEECLDFVESPTHPLELVAPCPPWCQYRDADPHTPTGLLVDHFHAAHEFSLELGLQRPVRTSRGLEAESLELHMEHMPHAAMPQLDLTVGSSANWRHASLTFEEADQLRAQLNEFIAQGREYAQPQAVSSLQELLDYCGVRLVEHEGSASRFLEHAVGDTRQGGPVWVTVPKGIAGPYLEGLVKSLLAEIHESQKEFTVRGDTAEHTVGEASMPTWTENRSAA
ncbi:DUF6907 domain-containing protein [Streptomyces melanogenes]|uniref:PRTRC system protein F n=1 Tax=Streptomyces melanogenes TaxID=67326 RepID=A0ABZ1XSU6_9ACTN|nr:hypothetical protein [Streptomyces melanogenes]